MLIRGACVSGWLSDLRPSWENGLLDVVGSGPGFATGSEFKTCFPAEVCSAVSGGAGVETREALAAALESPLVVGVGVDCPPPSFANRLLRI